MCRSEVNHEAKIPAAITNNLLVLVAMNKNHLLSFYLLLWRETLKISSAAKQERGQNPPPHEAFCVISMVIVLFFSVDSKFLSTKHNQGMLCKKGSDNKLSEVFSTKVIDGKCWFQRATRKQERRNTHSRTVLHAPLPLSDKYIANYFLQTTTSRSQ